MADRDIRPIGAQSEERLKPCARCLGTGWVTRSIHFAGDTERPCPVCRGRGKVALKETSDAR